MPSSSGQADAEPHAAAGGSSGTPGRASGEHQQSQQQPGPGLQPGGLAPGHAPPEEWAAAMFVLQGACVLHAKTRTVLGTAQYLQVCHSLTVGRRMVSWSLAPRLWCCAAKTDTALPS